MKCALALFLLLVGAPLLACDKVFIRSATSVQESIEYVVARTPSGTFQVPVINGNLPAVYEDKDAYGNVYRRRFDFSIPIPYNREKYGGKEIAYKQEKKASESTESAPPTAPFRRNPRPFKAMPEDSTLTVQHMSPAPQQSDFDSIQAKLDEIKRLLKETEAIVKK